MSNINKDAVFNPYHELTSDILDYVPRATTSEFGIVAIGSGINVDALGRIYLDTQEYSNRLNAIEAQATSSIATQQTEITAALTAYVGGRKAYTTLALAQADQANLPVNTAIEVTNDPTSQNNGTYQWNGTTLTKSSYSPLTQAKRYTDNTLADGYIKNYTNTTLLLGDKPPVLEMRGRAEDNRKIYLWNRTSAEGITPVTGTWTDTGLSDLDQSKDYTDTVFDEKFTATQSDTYVAVFSDDKNYTALGIKENGVVHAPKFESQEINNNRIEIINHNDYLEIKSDEDGNIVFGIRNDGSVDIPKLNVKTQGTTTVSRSLTIGSDDSIQHIGDSMTASHYCVQDKSYVSQLSQLSPYRHINYGVSGNDLLNMQSRVLNDVKTFGASLKSMKPTFAFIASFANDWRFTSENLQYYQENMRRLIDVCLAHGVQPVLISYFTMNSTQHQSVKSIADEYQIPIIWNDVLNQQVGFYTGKTLFHEGHTGTRNGGLWWIPMLEYIKQQKPMRTIKVFRKRAGFTIGTDLDLLFKSTIDKSKKWKEITIAHYSLANEYKYDELDSLDSGDLTWTLRDDEYIKLANKTPIPFSDYALIEIGLDALQKNLNLIEINLSVVGTVSCYVRNNLDKSTEIIKVPPTDPNYQAHWNEPRGKWRLVDLVDGKITINRDDVIFSMVGNKIYLMIKGSFTLSDISVDYAAEKYENSLPTLNNVKQKLGAELLTQPLLGSAQLSGWTLGGTVNSIIPIDVSNAPRKPDVNVAVDGVVTLTPSNYVQQSVSFASSEELRTFKVVAWARYFPKAFLDMTNTKYSSLDSTQVIDRSQGGALAPITKDTLDLKVLQLETWTEATRPTSGGACQFDFAALQWRPLSFYIEVQPYATSLSIRLNSKDGEIQLAKCSIKEVI